MTMSAKNTGLQYADSQKIVTSQSFDAPANMVARKAEGEPRWHTRPNHETPQRCECRHRRRQARRLFAQHGPSTWCQQGEAPELAWLLCRTLLRLAEDVHQQHSTADVVEQRDTLWGMRYDIVAPLTGPSGDTVMFRSVCQIDLGSDQP